MNNGQIQNEINSLERKVKLLISEHQKLKQTVNTYQDENKDLRNRLKSNQGEMASFQNRIKMSKIVENMVVEKEETKDLKEILDDYIKEIDKCIAHMSDA